MSAESPYPVPSSVPGGTGTPTAPVAAPEPVPADIVAIPDRYIDFRGVRYPMREISGWRLMELMSLEETAITNPGAAMSTLTEICEAAFAPVTWDALRDILRDAQPVVGLGELMGLLASLFERLAVDAKDAQGEMPPLQ